MMVATARATVHAGAGRAATARAAARPTPRPAARATSPAPRSAPRRPPELRVVPARRRVVRLAAVGLVALFGVMFAVTAFQTRIAQNQLDIDRIDERIVDAREQFTRLRLERAGLLAPDRLMAEASALGMVAGGDTQFATIAPQTVAQVAVATAGVPATSRERSVDPLAAYGTVKALMDGAEGTDGGD